MYKAALTAASPKTATRIRAILASASRLYARTRVGGKPLHSLQAADGSALRLASSHGRAAMGNGTATASSGSGQNRRARRAVGRGDRDRCVRRWRSRCVKSGRRSLDRPTAHRELRRPGHRCRLGAPTWLQARTGRWRRDGSARGGRRDLRVYRPPLRPTRGDRVRIGNCRTVRPNWWSGANNVRRGALMYRRPTKALGLDRHDRWRTCVHRLHHARARGHHGYRMDWLAYRAGHMAHWRTGVPPGSPVNDFVADRDRGAKVDLHAVDRHSMVVEVARQKVPAWNEAPRRVVTIDDYSSAERRERGPADVSVAVTPVDPGRRPNGIRYPYPTKVRIGQPASIMEWSPSPLVVALEGPAVIGVDPVPARRVGAKAEAHDRHPRTPHAAILSDVQPLTIRRQRVVERVERNAYLSGSLSRGKAQQTERQQCGASKAGN